MEKLSRMELLMAIDKEVIVKYGSLRVKVRMFKVDGF
jgi:hypothetical protein